MRLPARSGRWYAAPHRGRPKHGSDQEIFQATGGEPAQEQCFHGRGTGLPRRGTHDSLAAQRTGLFGLCQGVFRASFPRTDSAADYGDGSRRYGDERRRESGRSAGAALRQAETGADRCGHVGAGRNAGRRCGAGDQVVPRPVSSIRSNQGGVGQHTGFPRRLRAGVCRGAVLPDRSAHFRTSLQHH